MENKVMVLSKIKEYKEILFGVFSDTLTKQTKSDKWKEVYNVARLYNVVSGDKDWSYIRDTFWQNCRKYTLIKIENSKKNSGRKYQLKLNQCDEIVLDIVGREPKANVDDSRLEEPICKLEEGLSSEEYTPPPDSVTSSAKPTSSSEYIAPSDVLTNSAKTTSNVKTSIPVPSTYNTRSNKLRLKKGKERLAGLESSLSIKKKKLMIKRLELLNQKTMLEIALLEKQLEVHTPMLNNDLSEIMNNSNEDDTRIEEDVECLMEEDELNEITINGNEHDTRCEEDEENDIKEEELF